MYVTDANGNVLATVQSAQELAGLVEPHVDLLAGPAGLCVPARRPRQRARRQLGHPQHALVGALGRARGPGDGRGRTGRVDLAVAVAIYAARQVPGDLDGRGAVAAVGAVGDHDIPIQVDGAARGVRAPARVGHVARQLGHGPGVDLRDRALGAVGDPDDGPLHAGEVAGVQDHAPLRVDLDASGASRPGPVRVKGVRRPRPCGRGPIGLAHPAAAAAAAPIAAVLARRTAGAEDAVRVAGARESRDQKRESDAGGGLEPHDDPSLECRGR